MKSPTIRMALRNLAEHKRKSVTVGSIVAAAAFIFIIGSSLLESATSGMKKSYQERFTGDLYITAKTQKKLTSFGWEDQTMMGQAIPTIPRHPDIKAYLKTLPGVEAVTSRSATFSRVTKDASRAKGVTLLFGIEPGDYASVFPEAFRGTALGKEDALGKNLAGGILVSSILGKGMGKDAGPGEKVLLSSFGASSAIREAEIREILPDEPGNPVLGMVSYVPIDTVRALLGQYRTAQGPGESDFPADAGKMAGPSPAQGSSSGETTPAGTDPNLTEESLFGTGSITQVSRDTGFTMETLLSEIASLTSSQEPDPDAWHYILVKTKPGTDPDTVRALLDDWFASQGILAQAHTWIEGAGMIVTTILTVKSIFYYIFFMIAFVALLIIMNALVISVTERTGEIGTMRALGAKRRFITRMIVTETLLLSGISGLLGAALGSLAILLLGAIGIRTDDFILSVLFGGSSFKPDLSAISLVYTLAAVLLTGALASWYPARVALRVAPSTAMIQE